MRVLFVFEAGEGTIFPIAPFAHAVRGAGHEVFAAAHAGALPTLISAGLPAVATTSKAPRDYRTAEDGSLTPLPEDPAERETALGQIGARMGVDAYHGLRDVVRHWRPDLVVGGVGAYAGPLAAADAGVPYVRFAVDMGEPRVRHRAALDSLDRLGFADLPEPALSLTVCPDSIRPADAPAAELMRHVLYATPRPVEPWMLAKGRRPRLLVSAGSRVSRDYALDYLSGLVRAAATLDVELLVAAPDSVVGDLPPLPAGARAGWIPFDVVAATCDLALHHGGGITLGCMTTGVPQVFVPFMPEVEEYTTRLDEYGAAKTIPKSDATAENIVASCREVLTDPSYRRAAGRLRAEIRSAPAPRDMVARLEAHVTPRRLK